MSIILLLIICSISIAFLGLIAFIWWVKSEQSEDLETPAFRMLFEDKENTNNSHE